MKKTAFLMALAGLSTGFLGCAEEADEIENYGVNPEYTVTRAALNAQCSIAVQGYGTVAMETDYVPNTTWCENGNAPDEALKSQSAAARTFAYYKISTNGTPVKNSQGDQVYKCESRAPSAAQLKRCQDATNATSGYVMMYKGTITAGFYVSGVTQKYLNSECKPTVSSGQTGWVNVQNYVTYNWGKSGGKANGFTQTSLGWVNDGNKANRGCMAQNGASCLANNGWKWPNILRYFYGADIEITKASGGSCVLASSNLDGNDNPPEPPKCTTVLDKSGTIIDDQDPCFSRSNTTAWWEVNAGHNNHLWFTYVWDKAAEAIGTWTINVKRAGTYEVFVYIATGVGAVSEKAPYTIRASGKETKVSLNLNGKSGWTSLGKFTFANGGDQWIKLDDASGEPYTDKNGKRILFDAIKFEDAVTCTDACTNGAKQCSGNGVQTCSKGSNGCTAWGAAVACAGDEECKSGACQKKPVVCNNTCEAEGMRECSGNGYHVCTKDGNGCLAWSGVTACSETQSCSNGACVENTVPCTSECTAESRQCSGAGYVVCGDYDQNGCFEWGTNVTACGDGETCQNGACVATGTDPQPPVVDPLPAEMPAACLTAIDGRPSTIIDELDACFVRSDSSDWSELNDFGYEDHLFYAKIMDEAATVTGTWYLNVTAAGKYTVYAHVEGGIGDVAEQAVYTIHASGADKSYGLSIGMQSGWSKLADVDLAEGETQYIRLQNASHSADDRMKRVVYDAIQVVPYGTKISGGLVEGDDPDTGEIDPGTPDDGDKPGSDDKPKPDSATDAYTPEVRLSSESDCSGTPMPSDRSVPLFMLMCGIAGIAVLRRRRV